jgi:DNA-binding CsgD family transcriptional regulator
MKSREERNQLSAREEEVLRLAGTGLTDQQIANVLNIKVSTVTTYWVRIRVKVGQLNRAELISLSLRQQSQDTINGLRAEIARLSAELARKQAHESSSQVSAEVFKAALDAISSGMVIVRPDGAVAVSNRAARSLLGTDETAKIREILDSGRRRAPQAERGPREVGARLQVQELEGSGSGWYAVILDPTESAQ